MRVRQTRHSNTQKRTRRTAACVALVVAMSLVVSASAAADEQPRLHWFDEWSIYNADSNLPHDDVRAIAIAKDAVWIGTRGGLAQLRDGKWRHWRESDGLPSDWVSAIAYDDATHDLWIGTWGGGLVRYTAGRFDSFNQLNSGLAGNMVFALALDGRRVWAATNGGISCFAPSSDTWALFEAKRADCVQEAFTSLVLNERYLSANAWCGAIGRIDISQLDLQEFADSARFSTPSTFEGMLPTFTMSGDSTRLAWTSPHGLLYSENVAEPRGHRRYDCNMLDAASTPRCMTISANGIIWIGRADGLMAVDLIGNNAILYRHNGDATLYQRDKPVDTQHVGDILPGTKIRCLAADGNTLWIGTDGGLVRARSPIAWKDIQRASTSPPRTATSRRPNTTSQTNDIQSASPGKLPRSDTPTIDIAVLGPIEQTIGLPGESDDPRETSKRGDMLAVQMAMQQANAAGGFHNQCRYAAASSSAGYARYGWTTPEDEFCIFAERPNVVGLIGEIAPENRVACYVALQCEVPMVNTTLRSKPYHEAINPWLARCPRNDYDTHQRLLDTAALAAGGNRLAIVEADDVEEDAHFAMWRLAAVRGNARMIGEASWKPGDADAMQTLDAFLAQNPDVLLTWCDAATSAAILEHAVSTGWRGAFIGSDWIVSDAFTKTIGSVACPVFSIRPGSERPSRLEFERFIERYTRQSSPVKRLRPPTPAAIANYDATLLMLAAIDIAGPVRNAVRAALNELSRPIIVQWKADSWRPVENTRLSSAPRGTARSPAHTTTAPPTASAR